MNRALGRRGARVLSLVVLASTTLIAGALCVGPVALGAGVPMEYAVGGLTAEEMLAQQADLHRWLMDQMPVGTLDRRLSIRITENDAADLRKAIEERTDPFKVGVVKSVQHPVTFASLAARPLPKSPSTVAGGTLRATDDGGFVWALAIRSDGAVGVRVHFDKVDLPADADLFIMNLTGQAFGPYNRQGPDGTGDFWSNTVSGDTAVVLLRHYGPEGAAEVGRSGFLIADVGHLGAGFQSGPIASTESFCSFNASCVENASCHNGSPADPAKSAVALMQWVAGAFIYTCTGGLVNDTVASSQIPYFLTANHCLSTSGPASNLETYFQFSLSCGSTSCPGQTNPGGIQRLGSTVKATGSAGDFTLLQLSQTPPSGSVFLGWTNTAVANTNGVNLYRISHPAWAPQSYSDHTVDTSAPTCTGWPRGQRIYSRDGVGATEGGSSGSPVVNASSQIVGQLSGACGFNPGDPCDNTSNATVDGAFAYYYASVAPFLNPGTGGCTPTGQSCTINSQCCSNRCKGPSGNKTCK